MKTTFVTAILLAFSINLLSQQAPAAKDEPNIISAGKNYSEASSLDINTLKYNVQSQTQKKKSVALGVVLSALIPGAGEFYGEEYLKAAVFFGVEVLAWGTYIYYTVRGDNKTQDFENYADNNWNVRRYARWLKDEFGAAVNPDEPNDDELWRQINAFEQTKFTHTLPPHGTQQYYELIGKYQNFMGGWADAENNGQWVVTSSNYFTYKTAMFNKYSIDRGDANSLYNTAKIGPIVAIVNHILSAADAAWTISTYNKKIGVETGFRIDQTRSPFTYRMEYKPTFNMKISF